MQAVSVPAAGVAVTTSVSVSAVIIVGLIRALSASTAAVVVVVYLFTTRLFCFVGGQ